jgi:hypothetical protein
VQSRSASGAFFLKMVYTSIALTEIGRAHIYFSARHRVPEDYAPDFICIGAQKTGTSWLDVALRQHPDIMLPPGRKELHFYDTGFWKGKKWYAWNFRGRQSATILGDITPAYATLSEERVKKMAAFNRNATIIFILRDPVERAWSMAYMDLVKNPNRRLQDCPDEAFHSHFKWLYSLSRGSYSKTIRNFSNVFGNDMPHILFYDDLCADPDAFLKNVLDIINVDSERVSQTDVIGRRVNVGGVPVPTRFRLQLREIYESELAELRSLIDRTLWPEWLKTDVL